MIPGTLAAVSLRSDRDMSSRVSICIRPVCDAVPRGSFLGIDGFYKRNQYAEYPAMGLTIVELRRIARRYGSDPDFIIWSPQ